MVKSKDGTRLLAKEDKVKARRRKNFLKVPNRPVPKVTAEVKMRGEVNGRINTEAIPNDDTKGTFHLSEPAAHADRYIRVQNSVVSRIFTLIVYIVMVDL